VTHRRHLIGAHEAPALLGIPAATVRQWAKRRRIYSRGLDRFGRPLYDVNDLRERHTQRAA